VRLHDECRQKTFQPLLQLFPARSEEKIRAALVSRVYRGTSGVRSITNSGYGLPPADTGVRLLNWLANASTLFVHLERG